MPKFTLRGRKKFHKTVKKRNRTNNLMMNLGRWRDNMASNFQKKRDQMDDEIQTGWDRHNKMMNHVKENGINGEGQIADFNYEQGTTKITGKIGAHRGRTSKGTWERSNNNLHASLLDGQIQTGGENWDFNGNLRVGEVDASINHRMVRDKINLRDGFRNGPRGSARGQADIVHFTGRGTFGTDKDDPIGIRLRGNIDAAWGARAGVSANMNDGINPFNHTKFGPRFHGGVDLVVDHKKAGSDTREEIATFEINQGKIDGNVNWKELGSIIPNPKWNPLKNIFGAGKPRT